jgi:hypothetical protein
MQITAAKPIRLFIRAGEPRILVLMAPVIARLLIGHSKGVEYLRRYAKILSAAIRLLLYSEE